MSGGEPDERLRRWRLALGVDGDDTAVALSADDRRIDAALGALYSTARKGRGSLGGSAPRVSRWLGDIREYFSASVVQTIQRDAFERHGLKQMLLEPEFLAAMEADVHLVADLMSLRGAVPEQTRETAREVVAKVVEALMEQLRQDMSEAVRGAIDRSRRTRRPRQADIDWPRTITANLRHYQPALGTIVPERLVGAARRARALSDLEEVVLCVDQSGSMATSVVYSAIFAAVLASLPGIATQMVAFDTSVFDMSELLEDPVDVLFGVQLGGGTDINQAVAYCEQCISRPAKAHLVLITDLFEGGDAAALVERIAALHESGVNVIVLLALSDDGRPAYNDELAAEIAAFDCPVFACTPDQFPGLMGTALSRGDLQAWAAGEDIALVRG